MAVGGHLRKQVEGGPAGAVAQQVTVWYDLPGFCCVTFLLMQYGSSVWFLRDQGIAQFCSRWFLPVATHARQNDVFLDAVSFAVNQAGSRSQMS